MKIILIFLSIFTFSFSNPFSEINIKELKSNLIYNNFEIEKTDDYLFFNKKDYNFRNNITIFFLDNNVYSISIISSSRNIKQNKYDINLNLKNNFDFIKKFINNKHVVSIIDKNIHEIININKTNYVDLLSYSILTTNFTHEQSIKISLD